MVDDQVDVGDEIITGSESHDVEFRSSIHVEFGSTSHDDDVNSSFHDGSEDITGDFNIVRVDLVAVIGRVLRLLIVGKDFVDVENNMVTDDSERI